MFGQSAPPIADSIKKYPVGKRLPYISHAVMPKLSSMRAHFLRRLGLKSLIDVTWKITSPNATE